MRDRRAYVLELVRAGASKSVAIERGCKALGCEPNVLERLYLEITTAWSREFEQTSKAARPEAIERVRLDVMKIRAGDIVRKPNGQPKMAAKRDEDGRIVRRADGTPKRCMVRKVDWPALARAEKLLAELEGTLAPLEVKHEADVTVRAAVLTVVASLGPEEQRQLIAEQEELERRAGRAGEISVRFIEPTPKG